MTREKSCGKKKKSEPSFILTFVPEALMLLGKKHNTKMDDFPIAYEQLRCPRLTGSHDMSKFVNFHNIRGRPPVLGLYIKLKNFIFEYERNYNKVK